jgi:iron complex outermembrane recepter protein
MAVRRKRAQMANPTNSMKKHVSILTFAAAVCVAIAQPAAGQVVPPAPTTPSAAAPADKPLELSPFVVSEESDTGWLATSTLAGSRMNTPLRDTGASIAVMTSEFLRDIGAVTLEDAVGYAVNIHMATGEGPSPDQNPSMFNFENSQVRVRGVAATVTRNYFRWEVPGDTYNTDRIEENRGPNSILFGVGSAAAL